MCIQYCHSYIENLYLTWEKQVCNFVIFCNFFACARSILKNFGLETEHLFYVALLYVQHLPQNDVEMSYIEYEVHFLPLFYVQNIKISMYVQNIPHFNFSF